MRQLPRSSCPVCGAKVRDLPGHLFRKHPEDVIDLEVIPMSEAGAVEPIDDWEAGFVHPDAAESAVQLVKLPAPIVEYLERTDALKTEDADDIALRIAERIMEAETAADVLSPQDTIKASDLLGRPLAVYSFDFMRSGFADGSGVYVLIDAADPDTGEMLKVTCGAKNVIVQLFRLKMLGALPANVKIVPSAKPTSQGYRPLWLAPVDAIVRTR